MGEQILNILYLEDNRMDAEVVEALLEEEGIAASITVVSDREMFREKFRDEDYDAVFLDYAVPGYSGTAALDYVRSNGYEKPVIIVSGTIGEERAVEIIKRGASDYVLKHNVCKLVPALNRALNDYRNLQERKSFSRRIEEANKELQEKNFELDRANFMLRDLDRMKSEFISLASHEMRTPLTGMLGYAETLLSDDVSLTEEEKRTYLEIIADETRRLSRLLNRIMEISKIEGKVYDLTAVDFDIVELINGTAEKLEVPPEVDFSVVSHSEDSVMVRGDREKIGGVLKVLLRNAVEHTRDGGRIRVEVGQRSDEVVVAVEDTGTGVPEEDLNFIFEKFYRLGQEGQQGMDGFELAVAKRIIELHGGRMWVRSSLDGGVAVHFSLSKGKGI
ncbi:MAG: ATP-binding protein [Chitinispirillaceae bacterium]